MSRIATATATATATPTRPLGRLRRVALAGSALGVAAVVGLAGSAQAAQATTVTLAPGQSACVTQYAAYQVRGLGGATADGARFKILRNGQVVLAAPGRATSWNGELRSAYGTFPGAGVYAVCAYNTGTRTTTATIQIRTDAEL